MVSPENGPDQTGRVPPELYTLEYFTTDCDGHDLYLEDEGGAPARIIDALDMAGDLEGKRVLDIGCGRGELTCEAARRGARAVGIDYAEAAIELSRRLLDRCEADVGQRIEFLLADAGELPFPDDSFDAVFMVDVYEHLYPHQVKSTLEDIKRVLRPGGSLVVHTGPSTWFYRYGYPAARFFAKLLLGRELRESLRGDYDSIMHVNEQSPVSLYRELRDSGFRAKVLPRSYVSGYRASSLERYLLRLLFMRPAGYFFCMSLLAVAAPRREGSEAGIRAERVFEMMGPLGGDRVLLVGDREGLLVGMLSRMADVETTWLDPVPGSDTQQEELPAPTGCRRLAGDCYHLPFPDEHFDAAAAQLTLDHLDEPDRALSEWARVLTSGGRLTVVVRNSLFTGSDQRPGPRRIRSFSLVELEGLMERAGLEPAETSALIPDLRLPALYRGDLSFSYLFERLPFFRTRGKLLFLSAVKGDHGG